MRATSCRASSNQIVITQQTVGDQAQAMVVVTQNGDKGLMLAAAGGRQDPGTDLIGTVNRQCSGT